MKNEQTANVNFDDTIVWVHIHGITDPLPRVFLMNKTEELDADFAEILNITTQKVGKKKPSKPRF